VKPRLLRSRLWTGMLATVLGGFVLLGLAGMALRSSTASAVVSFVLAGAALFGFSRVLQMGVLIAPSGVAVRELTRTTLIPWTRVRSVTCEKTDRRGIHAPVLRLTPGPGGAQGKDRLELTVLASYRAEVAQQRTDAIAAARPAAPRKRRK
jgi:hypothetical protein